MPYSITREDGTADAMALQDALNVLKASAGWDSPTAARLRELRDSIESQLPKAPVEEPTEPTEFGSVILARADHNESRTRWSSPVASESGWYSEDGAFVGGYQMLRDVEVLRVGIGEPAAMPSRAALEEIFAKAMRYSSVADVRSVDDGDPKSMDEAVNAILALLAPSPAEAVEADKAALNDLKRRLANAEEDAAAEWLRSIPVRPPEPSPEQVEAAVDRLVAPGMIDLDDVQRELDDRPETPTQDVDSLEDDPIEALVQEFSPLATDMYRDKLTAFARRVLEVGGRQTGVPVEKVWAQHADFLNRAKWARNHGEGMAAAIWASAADLLHYLLPEEPTS